MQDLRDISVIVLAGGQGRRMGGENKGLLQLAGRPLIEHVLRAIPAEISQIFISANQALDAYAEFGLPVIHDLSDDNLGPLAGIQAVLPKIQTPFIQLLPCDAPFFPAELIASLHACVQLHSLCVPHDGQRLQPLFAQMHTATAHSIDAYLAQGQRKVQTWLQQEGYHSVDFSAQAAAFMNINTPQQLQQAMQQHDG